MVGVENEILRLRPNCLELDQDLHWVMVRGVGEGVVERLEVPLAFWPLLELQARGSSLAGMANWLRGAEVATGRFRLLRDFLNFLYEHDLLMGSRTIELAEALRSDASWRESAVFSALFSFELFRFNPRRISSVVTQLAFLIVLFAVAGATVHGLLTPPFFEWQLISSAWPLLAALIFSFSLGRTTRALAQLAVFRFLSSFTAALRLRLDLFSLSFATDDVSLVRQPRFAYVIGSGVALIFLASPVILLTFFANFANQMPIQADSASYVGFFTALLFLVDLSPFRASPMTEFLRTCYTLLDRRSRATPHDQTVEALLSNIHKLACLIWMGFFASFLIFPLRRFVHYLKQLEQISAIVMLLVLAGILISLAADMLLSLSEASGDLGVFRRLWRRRPASSSIIESASPSAEELERLPLIRQMDARVRSVLLSGQNARVIDVEEGQVVCRQGDTDRKLFVVLSGRLAVYKENSSHRNRLVTFLESGAVFGEVSFFFGAPRTATVRAAEAARVLAIRHDERIADLDPSRSSELQLRIWFLAAMTKSGWFKDLPAEAMDALVFAGQRFEVRGGQKVITEGERGDSCFFIVEGKASAIQNFKTLNRLGAGDVFGEISLLQPGLLRTATIVADTDLLMIKIDGERFWALLCSHLPLAIELEKLAERRLRSDARRAQLE